MSGESGEENWEVRCEILDHYNGVEWIYAQGMKSLKLGPLPKFS